MFYIFQKQLIPSDFLSIFDLVYYK